MPSEFIRKAAHHSTQAFAIADAAGVIMHEASRLKAVGEVDHAARLQSISRTLSARARQIMKKPAQNS